MLDAVEWKTKLDKIVLVVAVGKKKFKQTHNAWNQGHAMTSQSANVFR